MNKGSGDKPIQVTLVKPLCAQGRENTHREWIVNKTQIFQKNCCFIKPKITPETHKAKNTVNEAAYHKQVLPSEKRCRHLSEEKVYKEATATQNAGPVFRLG